MMKMPPLRRSIALGAALALVTLVACDKEALLDRMRSEIHFLWHNPARNTQVEDELARLLKDGIDRELAGEEFEITGPNPYLHHVKRTRVELGHTPPQVDIPGDANCSQTNSHYYIWFDWELVWDEGNGARVDLHFDLRSHAWYLFKEFPDHSVHIRDISASGNGSAWVVIPKNGNEGQASVTVRQATVDLSARAEGWFWSFSVRNEIKSQLDELLVREVIGRTLEETFPVEY